MDDSKRIIALICCLLKIMGLFLSILKMDIFCVMLIFFLTLIHSEKCLANNKKIWHVHYDVHKKFSEKMSTGHT